MITLPPISTNEVLLPKPKLILDCQVIQKGKYRPKMKVLIQWKWALQLVVFCQNLSTIQPCEQGPS